jgi:hypothetical protein
VSEANESTPELALVKRGPSASGSNLPPATSLEFTS